jgi:hypothetical protein
MELRAGNNGVLAGFITAVTVDIASVAAATVATTSSISVPGAEVGDWVGASPAAALSVAVGICHAFSAVADTVSMAVVNPTAGALDPASASINFLVLKPTNLSRTLA